MCVVMVKRHVAKAAKAAKVAKAAKAVKGASAHAFDRGRSTVRDLDKSMGLPTLLLAPPKMTCT